jgi:hypothetical protein
MKRSDSNKVSPVVQRIENMLLENRNREALEIHMAENRRLTREASAGVLADLHAAGYQVRSIQDLYDFQLDYRPDLSILIKWIPLVTADNVKEMLIRALAIPTRREIVAPALFKAFAAEPMDQSNIKWVIGNSLESMANDELYDELASIVADKRNGTSRQMVIMGLGKMKKRAKDATQLLVTLLDDDTVISHVLSSLRRLKAVEARPQVEQLLNHKTKWIAKEAQKTLDKFDSISAKTKSA